MAVDIVASENEQVKFPASPAAKAKEKVMPTGDEVFPIPCHRFLDTLDENDQIWIHWINRAHGRENHKMTEWKDIITAYKNGTHHRLNNQ